MMSRVPKFVTHDHWRAGVKFLMGLGTNPQLTADDQTTLRTMLRGPFARGMSEVEAERVLTGVMLWRKQ